MAASSVQRTSGPWKMLGFTSLLVALLFNGMMAQGSQEDIRGDNIVKKTEAPVPTNPKGQNIVYPTLVPKGPVVPTTAATTTPAPDHKPSDVPMSETTVPAGINDKGSKTTQASNVKPETPVPDPPRGDNSNNKPKPKPEQEVICVRKEEVEGKNSVQLKLRVPSNCSQTQVWILSVLPELCTDDCKLKLYQEDNTKEVLVSGKYVEDDVIGMTNKLNNIKDKIDVEEANPRWGKNSKLVLVSLLLAGLLLAALLVAGYYLKTHRKNSKGVRLADSFQVDEENQTNTLVSVAPLPQEPVDKPTINGESPPENGTNPTPTTNGHSANQSQVADTEM